MGSFEEFLSQSDVVNQDEVLFVYREVIPLKKGLITAPIIHDSIKKKNPCFAFATTYKALYLMSRFGFLEKTKRSFEFRIL